MPFTRSNGLGTDGEAHTIEPVEPVEPTPLFTIRPSLKRPNDVAVVELNHPDGGTFRTVLVRLNDDDTVTVRLLDGDPSERSSSSETQAVATLNVSELTSV